LIRKKAAFIFSFVTKIANDKLWDAVGTTVLICPCAKLIFRLFPPTFYTPSYGRTFRLWWRHFIALLLSGLRRIPTACDTPFRLPTFASSSVLAVIFQIPLVHTLLTGRLA
jgi:hypothetical protein